MSDQPTPPDTAAVEPVEAMERPERNAPGTLDEQGRLLCTSIRSRGRGPCNAPAIIGFDKCRIHVGKSVEQCRAEVDEALGHLAAKAVGVLAEVLDDPSAPHAVRAKVAQDVLDRRGHRVAHRVDVTRRDLTDEEALARAQQLVQDEVAAQRAKREQEAS